MASEAGLKVDVAYRGPEHTGNIAAETAVYRIIQESLANVLRHSKATQVRLRLSVRSDSITTTVRDNGTGFNAQDKVARMTTGLSSMRDRAISTGGTVDIFSVAGKGTVVRVRIPLRKPT